MKPILFWSGGKDSFLALLYWRKISKTNPILLTTCEEQRFTVPFQEIPLSDIEKQAKALSLELTTVPLPPKCPNDEYIYRVTERLRTVNSSTKLIFGDLWLEDIRQWREQVFNPYQCIFPLWKKPYESILTELWKSKTVIRINAVNPDFRHFIKKGQVYNQEFVENLPDSIDKMGERGEFHTHVIF